MFCDPLPLQLMSKNHLFLISWNGVDLPPSFLGNVFRYTVFFLFFLRHSLPFMFVVFPWDRLIKSVSLLKLYFIEIIEEIAKYLLNHEVSQYSRDILKLSSSTGATNSIKYSHSYLEVLVCWPGFIIAKLSLNFNFNFGWG